MKIIFETSFKILLIILIILSLFTIISAPLIGSTDISFSELMNIIFNIRLPRVIFAFLVGFSLALVGTIFQALLRNDLATPYTLGVSSGGAFGAVLAIKSGILISLLGFSSVTIFSVMGSFLTITIIYLIARSKMGISTLTLVLTGVTINLFFSALILFIHYLADFSETYLMIRWLMGGLQITRWNYSLILLPVSFITFGYFYLQAHAFNIISAGHEIALSKGVDVFRLQKISFVLASVLIGIIVAFAGPIGFIGLIIPHLLRLLIGADHRKLILAAPVFGGTFLVWCDTLARTIIAPAELPVGIITSLLGGPFFIWLLIRYKSKY
jgi:iron complex transport system permease protein